MHDQHQDVLDVLRSGKIDDEISNKLKEACNEVAAKYIE